MAVRRVIQTETVVSRPVAPQKVATYSAVDQLIYLIFGILEILLLLRFIFRMFGASTAAPVTRMIYNVTNILMAPFRFIFPTNVVEGAVFEWSVLVAMILYALLAWIIMQLIRILYTADTSN